MDTSGVIDINILQEDSLQQTHQDLKSTKTAHRPSISPSAMNSSETSSSPSSSTNIESSGDEESQHNNDNAKSQTSQIQPEAQQQQQPRQHQESTQVTEIENNESINSPPHFYPSFTASEYDYGGNEDYFYADPITSQEQASFMLNPSSYNFSGLQARPMTELPRAWDSQQQFLTQVGLKLYMFVPAVVAGTLLSITLWSLTMLLLRSYGWCRTKLFSKDTSQDLEMCPSRDNKGEKNLNEHLSGPSPDLDKVSRSEMVKTFSLQCESKSTKLLTSYCEEGKSVSSFHPSPVSLSSATSGIGVSERDSSDKESYGGDTSGQTTADLQDDDDDDQGHIRKQDHNWNNDSHSENYRAR